MGFARATAELLDTGRREIMTASFESLAHREREGLVAFARGMLADGHEAEDAAQEALLRLYRAWGRAENPRAFLYKTIANLCIDRLRHRSVPPGLPASGPGDEAAASGEAARPELDERAAAVRAAIEELPPDERAAVLLKEVERLSYAEIAATLDATVAQVTNWIHRGKNRLRRKLAPYMEEGKRP